MDINRDGHVHSDYCPHGSNDDLKKYINVAISKGIKEITFTEHMPMSKGIVDDEFYVTCAPSEEEIIEYFKEITKLKLEYKDIIKINIGLEVDYIEGYEKWITEHLNQYNEVLEDCILSVHFVKYNNKYYAIDILEYFEELLKLTGSLEKIYDLYFDTLLKSIKCDLGQYKPKRIGHPTLIRIFNKKYPYEYKNIDKLKEIIKEIKSAGYEIDVNTAGLRKKYCGEIYPSGDFFKLAKENNLNMVYGSDSHEAKYVGCGFKKEL